MSKGTEICCEIQYTKAADKFFKDHENVRKQYEDAVGEHSERIDVS